MTKFTLTVALFITVMTATFASGNPDPERARIVPAPGERFKVLYTSPEQVIVKIRLWDSNGHLLRTDRIKSNGGFMKPYNFSSLEKGTYFIELTDKFGVLKEKVEIDENVRNDYVAVRAMQDKKYRLIVEQDQAKPLSLTIYDAENEIVHQEYYNDMKGFTRVYDLSGINSKNFTFQLADDTSSRMVSVE